MNGMPGPTADPEIDALPESGSGWRRKLTGPIAAGVVLALFYALMLGSVRHKSLTQDEPGHVVAGYLYWKLNDYRVDPENGNLPQRWMALPFLFSHEDFSPAGQPCDSALLGDAWLNRQGYDTDSMIFRGRAVCALIAVALGAVVWLWSRRLFGDLGGITSLLLYVLNPAVLANGPLMTSDMSAALFFTLSIWRIWATLEKITIANVAGSILAVAGLFLSKMSAALVLPVALLLVVARIADGRPLPLGRVRVLLKRTRQLLAIAGVTLVHVVGVVLLVWCCFGFRFRALSSNLPGEGQFQGPWQWVLGQPNHYDLLGKLALTPTQSESAKEILKSTKATDPEWSYQALDALKRIGAEVLTPSQAATLSQMLTESPREFIPRLINWTRQYHLLPEAYLYGWAHVWHVTKMGGTLAFLNGELRTTGWRIFFPFVFLVKTPLALFGVAMIAMAGIWLRRRPRRDWLRREFWAAAWQSGYASLPLWIFFGLYWGVAVSSHINIGHRHLLPIYPAMIVLCGAAGRWFDPQNRSDTVPRFIRRRIQVMLVVLLAILGVETAARYPNYLAYFNGIVRPSDAYRHVVDSSLDWGQDLPAVAAYLRKHPAEKTYLAYFGAGRPSLYGINARLIGGDPGVDLKSTHPFYFFPEEAAPRIPEFLVQHSDYDPKVFFRAQVAGRQGRLLIHRGEVNRLTGGTYFISASALQPIYRRAGTEWSNPHEQDYQRLRARMQPWLGDDYRAKNAAMASASLEEWNATFDSYLDFRFARLTAFLRKREPDDQINYSILVYRLTDADVARALDGPSP